MPLIIQILRPLKGVITGASDLVYILRQDSRLIGLLAAYARKHGVKGLVQWLESGGDAV